MAKVSDPVWQEPPLRARRLPLQLRAADCAWVSVASRNKEKGVCAICVSVIYENHNSSSHLNFTLPPQLAGAEDSLADSNLLAEAAACNSTATTPAGLHPFLAGTAPSHNYLGGFDTACTAIHPTSEQRSFVLSRKRAPLADNYSHPKNGGPSQIRRAASRRIRIAGAGRHGYYSPA